MRRALVLIALVGCGDDGGSTPNPPPANAQPKTANGPGAAGGSGSKTMLAEKLHVEDRIACAIPEKPSDPSDKCDLKAPSCGEHLYCLPIAGAAYCEPCPERDGIRHQFKDRDFVAEQNRDPFEAGGTIGPRSTGQQLPPTEKCRRDDQMVATSYSYVDLKLVTIIAQGTQRKVLMMGGPLGYIIKRGDCVGKEKAVVTDIGTGYITFQVDPDSTVGRPPAEYSVQLNPKQLAANDPMDQPQAQRTTIAPLVAPPPVIPQGPGAPRGNTTVVVPGAAQGAAAAAAGAAMTPGASTAPTVVPPAGSGAVLPPAAVGSANGVPIVSPGGAAPGAGSTPPPTGATTTPPASPAGAQRVYVAPPK